MIYGWQLIPPKYRDHPLFVVDSGVLDVAVQHLYFSSTNCNEPHVQPNCQQVMSVGDSAENASVSRDEDVDGMENIGYFSCKAA